MIWSLEGPHTLSFTAEEYWNIGLNMLPPDSFMEISQLGYSTGEFQALKLIVAAVFSALD